MITLCTQCGGTGVSDRFHGLCPRCVFSEAISEDAKDPLEAEGRFGPLEIVQKIGRGGMGAVYKARQPQLNRFVALKILSPTLAVDLEFRDRFIREAQILASLDHPNIVQIYDFGECDGLYYLVMEYVEGTHLRSVLDSGLLSSEELLKLIPPICEALEYAHAQGIVHRDIKPENILVDRQGRVKITDFGIAKIANPSRKITQLGVTLGTPDYMAPEQHENFDHADHRADLYSVGAVIYEILTGKVPTREFIRPSRLVHTDPRMDRIVRRALAAKPASRYGNATQLKEELTHVLSTKPPRHSRRKWIAVGLAIVVVGGIGLLWHLPRKDNTAASFAPLPQDSKQESADAEVARLITELASENIEVRERACTRLARHVAANKAIEPRIVETREKATDAELRELLARVLKDAEEIRAKATKLVEKLKITETIGSTPHSLAVTPDGQFIASASSDGRIVLTRVADMREIRVLGTWNPLPGLLTFAPDGQTLAADMVKEVMIFDATTGEPKMKFDQGENTWALCFSADGKRLFCGSHTGLHVWDTATGKRERILTPASVTALVLSVDGTTLVSQSANGALSRWDVATWQENRITEGKKGAWCPGSIAMNPDGSCIAQVGVKGGAPGTYGINPEGKGPEGKAPIEIPDRHNNVLVLDIRTGKELVRHALTSWSVDVHSSSRNPYFACTSDEGLEFFRWDDPSVRSSVKLDTRPVRVSAVDESTWFVGMTGELRKVDLKTGRVVATAKPHKGNVWHAGFTRGDRHVVIVGKDGVIRERDLDKGQEKSAFNMDMAPTDPYLLNQRGDLIAYSSSKDQVIILDLKRQQQLNRAVIPEMRARPSCLVLIDENLIVGERGFIHVLDPRQGRLVKTIGEENDGSAYGVSPDGRYVARLHPYKGMIDVWEMATGTRCSTLEDLPRPRTLFEDMCICFSADGTCLYFSTCKDELRCVDIATGESRGNRTLEEGRARALVADPTGRYLAAWFLPGRIVLLHAPTLQTVAKLEGVYDPVFSKDGQKMLVHADNVVHLYSLEPQEISVDEAK